MRIIVRDNLGRDVTHEREWYIRTDGKVFYYTGDIDCPLYFVDNDYTWEVDQSPQVYNWFEDYGKRHLEINGFDYPSCCDDCSNNPKNGGSGICNCTLPYMQNPTHYTETPNINGYMYFATNTTELRQHKADADRIAAAKTNIEQFIKE